MDYITFNIYESLFWIATSGIAFILHERAQPRARQILLHFSLITLLFGLSDIAEVLVDGLFRKDLWWLIVWKALCLLGLFVILYRYLHLSTHRNK